MNKPILHVYKIGCYSFSQVFIKQLKNGLKEKYVTLPAIIEWLGEEWNQERIETVLKAQSWIVQWHCFQYEGGIGFSAVAIMAVVLCDKVSTTDERMRAAELVFTRAQQSKQAAKAFAPRF
mgnify:FL=1